LIQVNLLAQLLVQLCFLFVELKGQVLNCDLTNQSTNTLFTLASNLTKFREELLGTANL
tara:strand:- start:114 stop:290 length:177 start_codon:yes stop_codon:yes gene_type:complete